MYDCQNESFQILSGYSTDEYGTHNSDSSFRKSPFCEQKLSQHILSPGMISTDIKPFGFYSPSPFKKPCFHYMDQGNIHQEKIYEEDGAKKPQLISHIIDFNASPQLPKKEISIQSEPQSPKNERQSRKNSKGLRCLSESVYQIVLQLKTTTYKQVANRLVSALYQKGESDESLFRDQQNIKRRVYDALNVLISAEILQKNGKQVLSDNRAIPQKMRKHQNIAERQTVTKLQQQVQERHLNLEEKKQKFEELQRRNQVMKEILKRNRKKKFLGKEKISFPIVGVVFEPKKDTTMQLKNEKKQLKLQMNSLESIAGDIDLMMNIDMASHNVDEIMSDQIFDEEVEEIVEKKFKENL